MTWMWALWIVLVLGGFVLIEWYAFKRPDKQLTLSRTVYNLGKRWPLSICIFGVVIGAAATHFWWNWDPACLDALGSIKK